MFALTWIIIEKHLNDQFPFSILKLFEKHAPLSCKSLAAPKR